MRFEVQTVVELRIVNILSYLPCRRSRLSCSISVRIVISSTHPVTRKNNRNVRFILIVRQLLFFMYKRNNKCVLSL